MLDELVTDKLKTAKRWELTILLKKSLVFFLRLIVKLFYYKVRKNPEEIKKMMQCKSIWVLKESNSRKIGDEVGGFFHSSFHIDHMKQGLREGAKRGNAHRDSSR